MEWIIGIVGAAVAVSGWIAAFRARGESNAARSEANQAAASARLAERRAELAEMSTLDAQANEAEAKSLKRAAEETAASLRLELQMLRADQETILERIAKMGLPVGPDLFDSALRRLYEDNLRRSARAGGGASTGAGGGPPVVPDDPAKPPSPAGKG